MMHLILVIAVVIILAASYLLTFALCRAATRRDMLEARWREESAGLPRVPMLRARLQDSRRGGAA
jgi:hypothetical protein